jgi:transcriptional regulator with XRE-family HTH domain
MVEKIHNKRPLRWFLREWRQHRGFTLEQVADRLETTRGVVSELERGERRMNDGWISGFAWVYGCEPADLFHDPKRPTPNELLAQSASMMMDATPEQTARIVDFIQFTLRKAS